MGGFDHEAGRQGGHASHAAEPGQLHPGRQERSTLISSGGSPHPSRPNLTSPSGRQSTSAQPPELPHLLLIRASTFLRWARLHLSDVTAGLLALDLTESPRQAARTLPGGVASVATVQLEPTTIPTGRTPPSSLAASRAAAGCKGAARVAATTVTNPPVKAFLISLPPSFGFRSKRYGKWGRRFARLPVGSLNVGLLGEQRSRMPVQRWRAVRFSTSCTGRKDLRLQQAVRQASASARATSRHAEPSLRARSRARTGLPETAEGVCRPGRRRSPTRRQTRIRRTRRGNSPR